MSKKSSGTKTAGKIFAVFTGILLITVLFVSWFIGGQTRTAEKFCAALGSGDLKSYERLFDPAAYEEYAGELTLDKSEFRELCLDRFRNYRAFAELESADIVSSNVKITEHKMRGGIDNWECTADVDFYCSGMSISETMVFYMRFQGGKWLIYDYMM